MLIQKNTISTALHHGRDLEVSNAVWTKIERAVWSSLTSVREKHNTFAVFYKFESISTPLLFQTELRSNLHSLNALNMFQFCGNNLQNFFINPRTVVYIADGNLQDAESCSQRSVQ